MLYWIEYIANGLGDLEISRIRSEVCCCQDNRFVSNEQDTDYQWSRPAAKNHVTQWPRGPSRYSDD